MRLGVQRAKFHVEKRLGSSLKLETPNSKPELRDEVENA
jgi:hypothetical protein